MNPCCANLHFCLCPCKRSQLEPLCVHANTHKYAFFRSQLLLYKRTVCNSHMSVPLRALTVRTSLFTCKYSQVIIHVSDHSTFCIQTHCVQTHICLCPRECTTAHTSNLFVYMHISTNIHISCDGHMCTRTYGAETHIWLCPCKRSHLEPLCAQILTSMHFSDHKYFCIQTHCVQTHICLCPCGRSQLEPLCLHANTHKYTFFKSEILLYTNPLCATSYMSVPLQVHTLRTSLYTCIYPQI